MCTRRLRRQSTTPTPTKHKNAEHVTKQTHAAAERVIKQTYAHEAVKHKRTNTKDDKDDMNLSQGQFEPSTKVQRQQPSATDPA